MQAVKTRLLLASPFLQQTSLPVAGWTAPKTWDSKTESLQPGQLQPGQLQTTFVQNLGAKRRTPQISLQHNWRTWCSSYLPTLIAQMDWRVLSTLEDQIGDDEITEFLQSLRNTSTTNAVLRKNLKRRKEVLWTFQATRDQKILHWDALDWKSAIFWAQRRNSLLA